MCKVGTNEDYNSVAMAVENGCQHIEIVSDMACTTPVIWKAPKAFISLTSSRPYIPMKWGKR